MTIDRSGQIIDNKYRLVRLLGEGGMGAVYEAEHAVINRRCAVKFLHPEIAGNSEVVTRFVREAQAASAIRHKGIVDVYDVGTTPDGAPYLVMEFLDGKSLADELAAQPRLPFTYLAGVMVQALSALGAAHRRGIVHRDIKPDNLYVCTEAEGPPTIKLLDFGISKMSLAGKVTDRMTRTGTVLGTPYYMAPEQAAGKSDVDHRADLYSMGVILYEAATGRVPFEGENYNQLILKIFTEPYPQPREVNPEIPPELERIIIRAMDRNRDARYPDAEAMIHDLVEILGPDGRQDWHLPAHTGAAVERLSRTPLASSALRPQTPALARATQTTGGAEEPDRKSRTGLYVGLGIGALVAIGVVVFLVVGGGGGGEANDPATKTAAAGEPAGGEDAGAVAPPEDVVEPADAAGAKTAESDAGAPEPPADVATGAVDPPETTSAVPPPPSEAVRIVVQGAPDGAEILWDGAVVPDVSFAVRRGEIGVVLEVRAEGFKPLRQLLVPSEDRVVSVDLERLPVRTTSGGGRPPGRDAGTVAPPPADAGGSSSGGIRTNFPGGDTPPARDAGGGGIRTSWP